MWMEDLAGAIKVNIGECEHGEGCYGEGNLILFLIAGRMELFEEGQKYVLRRNDIVSISRNTNFCFTAGASSMYGMIEVPDRIFRIANGRTGFRILCNSCIESGPVYDELLVSVKRLICEQVLKTDHNLSFGNIGSICDFLNVLSDHFLKLSEDSEQKEIYYKERLRFINDYMQLRYNEQISLKDLAEKLYLSNAYLSRFFYKNYGETFTEVLTKIRVAHAADDLLSGDCSITETALRNGFSTPALFNKAFKKIYGVTPSEFRSHAKDGTTRSRTQSPRQELSEETQLRVKRLLLDGSPENPEPGKCIRIFSEYSVKNSRKYQKNWNQVINVGAITDLLEVDMQEHVLLLKEMFHFRYIRMWSVLSEQIISLKNGQKVNFRKLDIVLDFLMKNQIKPFLEFGEKDKVIIGNLSPDYIEKSRKRHRTLSDWRMSVEAFIGHVIDRYGENEVATWKIEVWDGGQEANRDEDSIQEYFSIFKTCYETIKAHLPDLEVGGCGSTAVLERELFVRNLRLWKACAPIPDFFSIMIYGYEPTGNSGFLSASRSVDPLFLPKTLEETRRIISNENFPAQKLYVTEWNRSLSDRNYLNDTLFQGADDLNNMIHCIGKASVLGYYHGSDRFMDNYDTADFLYGGRGLITKNGIVKPSGYAFRFLNRLEDYLIGKNDHCVVTTDQKNSYGIVCHNCSRLNDYYLETNEHEVSCKNMERYFEDSGELEMRFCLKDLPEGEYQVKILRVNAQHGSVMEKWAALGYYDSSSREITEYLQHHSEPEMSIYPLHTENHRLSLSVTLEMDEFVYIGIRSISF